MPADARPHQVLLPASGEQDLPAEDLLARYVYVEDEDAEDESFHVHVAGCACQLRGR